MITYRLTDLLMFWDRMLDSDFDAVKDVISVIYNDAVPDAKKLDIIIRILRFHGLDEYTKSSTDDFFKEPKIFSGTINPIQLFDIHFENGKIDFWQNLN